MRIHLISIGGAVMHNFALALHDVGHHVSGSDDAIFEPSKGRLDQHGLLPKEMGWDAARITADIDFIILGMHARQDNPELLKAKELGLPMYSFPAYTFEQSKDQTRMVVAGSHGKTTTTGMLMHVFDALQKEFDYLVGSQLDGYQRMVQFSDAPIILIEGDEYLSSPLDLRPKFLHYKPQLAMITGIAWDHINVFPTYANYVEQFELFMRSMPKGSVCFYNQDDKDLNALAITLKGQIDVNLKPYGILPYSTAKEGIVIHFEGKDYPMPWFGKHNVSNVTGAMLMAKEYGISHVDFIQSMQSFGGTARRLETLYEDSNLTVIRDFAHSPSKLKATAEAVKEQYPNRNVIAVFELHTFSSLQKDFLPHYSDCMAKADQAMVYVDHHVFELKKMPALEASAIKSGFGSPIQVLNSKQALIDAIKSSDLGNTVLLLMSSGSFSDLALDEII